MVSVAVWRNESTCWQKSSLLWYPPAHSSLSWVIQHIQTSAATWGHHSSAHHEASEQCTSAETQIVISLLLINPPRGNVSSSPFFFFFWSGSQNLALKPQDEAAMVRDSKSGTRRHRCSSRELSLRFSGKLLSNFRCLSRILLQMPDKISYHPLHKGKYKSNQLLQD